MSGHYTVTDLRKYPNSMEWGVLDPWGLVIAQFDRWEDAQIFRTAKDKRAIA